jgi:hypothetical protein
VNVGFTGTTTAALVTGTTKVAWVAEGTGTWVTGLLGRTGRGSGIGGARTGAGIIRATIALEAGFLVTAWSNWDTCRFQAYGSQNGARDSQIW